MRVYAFTSAGPYTGKNATTDAAGAAHFDPAVFAPGSYKFRIDYLGYQFWSDTISLPETSVLSVKIMEATTTALILQGGEPQAGVRVYLFSGSGAYLGQYVTTDADGLVAFISATRTGRSPSLGWTAR